MCTPAAGTGGAWRASTSQRAALAHHELGGVTGRLAAAVHRQKGGADKQGRGGGRWKEGGGLGFDRIQGLELFARILNIERY